MSQSQNAMQEPSMDELLASIREIIEENAGASLANSGKQVAESANREAKAESRPLPRHANNDVGGLSDRQDAHSGMKNNSGLPVQDAMNALAERIGLRKQPLSVHNKPEVAAVTKPAAVAAPAQPQRPAMSRESRPDMPRFASRLQPQKQNTAADMKQEADEAEKGFRADVERSAELLLRPYISQWLDEHFRQLFERILREEIQRFIQVLRR